MSAGMAPPNTRWQDFEKCGKSFRSSAGHPNEEIPENAEHEKKLEEGHKKKDIVNDRTIESQLGPAWELL